MKFKRYCALLLAVVLMLSLLSGCGSNAASGSDDNTLTITIMANRATEFCDAMVAKFPDINFEFNYYYGENMSGYLTNMITQGDAGDLIYYTQLSKQPEITDQFLDLSGYPFISNISDEVIPLLNVDDHIYQIPGPLEIRCVIYNKTLFAENGWKVPESHTDLVELVKQIRQEQPDMTPIAMSLGGAAYPFLAAATLSQCGFLSTPSGHQWERDFFEGKASIAEGFDSGLTMMEELINAGAFDTELSNGKTYVGKWNCNEEMVSRQAAMEFHWANMLSFMQTITAEGVTDEFGFLPFYGQNEDEKLASFAVSLAWSVNAKLAEPGNEKKLENAIRVMEWIATKDAQLVLSSNQGQYPVIKGAKSELISTYMDELWELAQDGYKSTGIYTGYEHVIVEMTAPIQAAMEADDATGMKEAVIEVGDRLNAKFLAGDSSEAHGMLTENLNEAQTAQFEVNAIHAAGLGDFALMTHSGRQGMVINTRGAAGQIYAGTINQDALRIIMSDADGYIDTMELTGAEVKALLESGKIMFEGEQKIFDSGAEAPENRAALPTASFPYYWAGIDVEMKDGKVKSVKLNGTELDNNATYTVAFQGGDYAYDLMDRAVQTEITTDSVMVNYIKTNSPLKAPEVLRK